jgi:hypothetical protein
MNQQQINFKEQREFGQILNSTFAFLRQNFSKLGKALIFFAGPFLLLQGIAQVYYQTNVGNFVSILSHHSFDSYFQNDNLWVH